MSAPFVTALTGGIGAGKSVVSHILRVMGYPVYDSDTRARQLMDSDRDIHAALCRDVHPRAVVDGIVCRDVISSVVFGDPAALARLNSIVHGHLVDDFRHWLGTLAGPRAFIETAILRQCPLLFPHVHDAWEVTAPAEVRVTRVIRRSGLTAAQVRARIEAQDSGDASPLPFPVHEIVNVATAPLLPRIHTLLAHHP